METHRMSENFPNSDRIRNIPQMWLNTTVTRSKIQQLGGIELHCFTRIHQFFLLYAGRPPVVRGSPDPARFATEGLLFNSSLPLSSILPKLQESREGPVVESRLLRSLVEGSNDECKANNNNKRRPGGRGSCGVGRPAHNSVGRPHAQQAMPIDLRLRTGQTDRHDTKASFFRRSIRSLARTPRRGGRPVGV